MVLYSAVNQKITPRRKEDGEGKRRLCHIKIQMLALAQSEFLKKKRTNEPLNLEKAKSDPKIRTRPHKGRKPKTGLTGLRKNNVQKTTGAVDIRIP